MWTRTLDKVRRAPLKARRKSLLSKKELTSGSGESAAVHHAHTSILSFSDEAGKGDYDPAVVSTVETLAVAGSDTPALKQEEEARSSGGIPSR
jgi:hypothetical protein